MYCGRTVFVLITSYFNCSKDLNIHRSAFFLNHSKHIYLGQNLVYILNFQAFDFFFLLKYESINCLMLIITEKLVELSYHDCQEVSAGQGNLFMTVVHPIRVHL